jgi:hypothetical protein
VGTSVKGDRSNTVVHIFSDWQTNVGGPMALMNRLSCAPTPPPAVARILEILMASMRDGKGLGDMSVVEDIKVLL